MVLPGFNTLIVIIILTLVFFIILIMFYKDKNPLKKDIFKKYLKIGFWFFTIFGFILFWYLYTKSGTEGMMGLEIPISVIWALITFGIPGALATALISWVFWKIKNR